jgi:hypothetical protein
MKPLPTHARVPRGEMLSYFKKIATPSAPLILALRAICAPRGEYLDKEEGLRISLNIPAGGNSDETKRTIADEIAGPGNFHRCPPLAWLGRTLLDVR